MVLLKEQLSASTVEESRGSTLVPTVGTGKPVTYSIIVILTVGRSQKLGETTLNNMHKRWSYDKTRSDTRVM